MKLHLPVRLRSAVLSCMAALATIGTTVITATMAGGAFSLVVSSSVSAETITVPVDDTSYADQTTTITGADSSFTVTGSGTPGTVYDYGEIVAKDGATVALTPYPTNASDSSKCVGKDAKLQIATSVTLENGSKLDCDDTSFYLKEPLTIVGSNTMNIHWSKSYDFESLAGNSDAVFDISLAAHDWPAYSLVRVLDTNATYQGKIALNNASSAQLALLGGGADTFSAASLSLGNNSKLLLGNEKVNVGSLEGSGRVELCPQSYVPTSEMVVPGSATLVVANGGGKVFSGSLGSGVSPNLSSGALTLSGLTVSDLSTIVADAGSTITLDGVTLSGQDMTLAGSGNYVLSGTVTIAGDFTDVTDGTVLLSKGTAAGLTLAEGATIKTSTAPTGYSSVVSLDSEGNLVINLTSATIDFNDAGTLYTNDMGVSMSYDADTKTYTGTYTNGDGQQTISRVFTEGNPVIIGAASAGVVPTDSMDLIVDSGTYDGLSFASIDGSTVGTAGSEDAPIKLNLEVNGSASVNNFIGGGSGLFGWTGASTSVKLYADISATINTTGSVGFLCLTGESNYSGTFKVYGDLVANVLNGTVNGDTGSGVTEPCAIAAGCKAVDIYGDVTYNIGQLGSSTGPTINGSIVGAMDQRNGGSAGSLTGDVTINLYGGTYNGNIYATGAKATVNGNYTVNYYGGTIKDGCKIAISSGGAVTGTKVLNICGNGVLDTTQFAYNDFDKVTIAENAVLKMVGAVTLGVVEMENMGTIDFAGVTSVALDLTQLTGEEVISEDGQTISARYVVLEGGTLTNTSTLGSSFSYEDGKLIYSATVNVNGWDVNWGVGGLVDAPDLATLTGVSTITANTWLGADATYINSSGDVQIRVTGGGGAGVNLYGGKQNAAFTGDTWLCIEGGTWGTIVGGTQSNASQANFTGSSHILIDGATVDHIYGGIHADAGSPVMTGDTYVSIKEGSVVNGWIAGGNVSWHNRTTKLVGNTNVWVYEVLTGEMAPSNQNGPASSNTAIIGGNAWLRNTVCNTSIEGSTHVNILLGANAAADVDAPTFGKLIVGGSLIGSTGGTSTGSISGSTNVTIDTTDCTKNVTFSKNIVAGAFLTGSASTVYTQGGDSNMSIAGNSTFDGMVILGCYVSNSQSATISGKSTLTISGGTFSNLVVGGMYENSGSSTVVSGDIELNLDGGTYNGNIIGGHYTTGNGTTAVTAATTGDITVTIGSNAVVNGTICGGTALQRTSGQSTGFSQGNVSVNLEEGATINGNIYAAGGDIVTGNATAVLTTESTRVAIDNGVNLKEGIVISGGYVGMGNSAGSTVTGDRTLALSGEGTYSLSGVTLQDFNVVEVTEADTVAGAGATLQSIGITRKTGAGTYRLMDGDVADSLVVEAGTLKVSSGGATLGSLTVAGGAALDATAGSSVGANVTMQDGSSLILGSTGLSLGASNSLTLGTSLDLTVTADESQSASFYKIVLADDLASVILGDTAMTEGQIIAASDYFSSITDSSGLLTDLSGASLKYENGTLYLTTAAGEILYWEGGTGNWSSRGWSSEDGGTDLKSYLDGAQAYFTGADALETITVDMAAKAQSITIDGNYSFEQDAEQKGSLAVSDKLELVGDSSADFNLNVDLSTATVVVAGEAELNLTGDTTIKTLENQGSVILDDGSLTIDSDVSAENTGSLKVANGDLTLNGDDNHFGDLNVSGALHTSGTVNLTTADGSSSFGSLDGVSVVAAEGHSVTLNGASVAGTLTGGNYTVNDSLTLLSGASSVGNFTAASACTLTLNAGSSLTIGGTLSGTLDVTLGGELSATTSQLTLNTLAAGTTVNFLGIDAGNSTVTSMTEGQKLMLASLTGTSDISAFTMSGVTSFTAGDYTYSLVYEQGGLYVLAKLDTTGMFVWEATGNETWATDGAWSESGAPTAGSQVIFNGGGLSQVVLGDNAVAARTLRVEYNDPSKIYTFTDGSLSLDLLDMRSGSVVIDESARVDADSASIAQGASLTVAGSLNVGAMTADSVTLDGAGSLALGDGSDVRQILQGENATGTTLAVTGGSVTVGNATVGGVNVADGATLTASSLTLTGTHSSATGTIHADRLGVTGVGNTLGTVETNTLVFSTIGQPGATDAVLTISDLSSADGSGNIGIDFSNLTVSQDGTYALIDWSGSSSVSFSLSEAALSYLAALRFDAVLDTTEAGSVNLVLSTIGEMVWRTTEDKAGNYEVPVSGENVYTGLDPITAVVVNGDRTLDYTQADPSSASVPSLGAVVRNMSGVAGNTLTFVGNGADEDLVTFVNDEGDAVGSHTIAGQNITLRVGADAGEFEDMLEAGILTSDDLMQNHALTVGGVTLEASRLEVSDADGVKFTTGVLDGDADSVISGTIHINGAGGKYEGSGENATIVLEQGADQLFTNAGGITLSGSAGRAWIDGGSVGALATTGADIVLVAPGEGEELAPVNLNSASSMEGGSLSATVDAGKVFSGEGADTSLFSGSSISLQGTHLSLYSGGDVQSMVADVDLSKTDGFVITTIHEDGLSSAQNTTVTLEGGLLEKYFSHATVEGNQIVASRNTSYYVDNAGSTANGSAGLALADGALVAINPQADAANYADLAGVLNSLDLHLAMGDRAGADRLGAQLAGAEAAGMGMAFSNDMDRQLRAIRNRTTTMGVGDEYVNPDMPYFNAWINAEGDYQQVKRDGTNPGYSLSSWGGTLGADVDFTPHFTAGLAITAMYGDYQAESNGMAEGDLNSYYVTLFGRYSGNSAWVHTIVASVGMADASLKRTVTHATGSYTAEGDTTGMGFGLLYELGYTIALNEEATTCLQPVFNLSYVHTTLDGYRESGSDAALNFGNQKMDSFTVGLGARLQTLVGENIYNRTSMFESRALLKFTTGDRNSSMHTALASLPATQATVKSEEQGAIGVELGAGLSVPLGADSGTLFIDGSLEAYTSYTNVNATVGWRINF